MGNGILGIDSPGKNTFQIAAAIRPFIFFVKILRTAIIIIDSPPIRVIRSMRIELLKLPVNIHFLSR